MKEEKIYKITCECCEKSETCSILNSYACKNFVPSIDSNYKYIMDPDLFRIEKQNFALYLS